METLGVKLSQKTVLLTSAGELIPAYTETHRRKNKYSVEFYPSGAIKKVALEDVQEVQTPLGEMPAELISFFESGEVNRVFPLDGKISGMWSEQEERALAIPLSFALPFTAFTAIIGGIAFYQSGDIRSITLFPGETVAIATNYGEIKARNGFSLYESGKLESLEPSVPALIPTPIGAISAFDPNAIGVNADINSLVFDEDGRVITLTTALNCVAVQTTDGRSLRFAPREAVNPLDNESMMTVGLIIAFDYSADTVTFIDGAQKTALSVTENTFTIADHHASSLTCGPMDCAACSLSCNKTTE